MKKITLNKKTLRVLTPAEEALISGGTDSSWGSLPYEMDGSTGSGSYGGSAGGYDGGFGYGGGSDWAAKPVPKGTFDSECRCASYGTHCAASQRIDDPKCKVQGD